MNDRSVEKLCTIAAATVVVGAGFGTAGISHGVLEAASAATGFVIGVRAERQADFRRLLDRVKRDVQGNKVAWIEREHQESNWLKVANVEGAFAEIEAVLDRIAPTPEDIVGVNLDGRELANRLASKFALSNPEFSANASNPAVRPIFCTIVAKTVELLCRNPHYMGQLRTYIDATALRSLESIKLDNKKIMNQNTDIKSRSGKELIR